MKEWAAVACTDAARWRALMDDARAYVASVNDAKAAKKTKAKARS
jgi:hypothetical protein